MVHPRSDVPEAGGRVAGEEETRRYLTSFSFGACFSR